MGVGSGREGGREGSINSLFYSESANVPTNSNNTTRKARSFAETGRREGGRGGGTCH
jgi:hypothetical protein